MRKALNSNPLVQVGLIAVLGVLVAFLMLTRMKGDTQEAETTPADTSAVAGAPADPAAAAPAPTGDAAAAPAPTADATVPPADVPPAPSTDPSSDFVAGPGLPADVVKAYDSGDSVVVLITRQGGIDDKKLHDITERLRGEEDIALFTSFARDTADYSRITEGVDIDRVPALIALSPKSVSKGGSPTATISYGFRDYDSVRQAVEDAAYEGKNLSYYP